MDDEEAYEAIGGSLKLKVAVKSSKKDKKDKKSKKKKKKEKKKHKRDDDGQDVVVVEEEKKVGELERVDAPTMTAAEVAFLEKRRKLNEVRLEKKASKSHRERVAEFNSYLSKLSEHHDLPKIGPG